MAELNTNPETNPKEEEFDDLNLNYLDLDELDLDEIDQERRCARARSRSRTR